MNKIAISFCLPVYNVSDYLPYCLDSILKTNSISYEIVCVDDGSTDSSYLILQEYANKYPFIKIEKNENNKGVSYTRNRAIEISAGEFIYFVDPDDIVISENIVMLYEIATKHNLDAATGNFITVSEDKKEPISSVGDFGNSPTYEIIKNEGEIVNYYAVNENGNSLQGCVIGLYRRNFIISNNLFFEKDLSHGEDIIWHFRVLLQLKEWARFSGICYNYRKRAHSACTSFNQARNIKVYANYRKMYQILTNWRENGIHNPPGMCNNYNALCLMIHLVQQHIANTLAMINDKKYVKQELKTLKKEKIYPYPFRKQILKEEKNILKKWLLYFLPLKPFFWIMHFLYSLRKNRE